MGVVVASSQKKPSWKERLSEFGFRCGLYLFTLVAFTLTLFVSCTALDYLINGERCTLGQEKIEQGQCISPGGPR